MDFRFVRKDEYEALNSSSTDENYAVLSRNALRILMMGWAWKGLYNVTSLNALKAAFIERNPKFLKQFRQEFQNGFTYLYEQLKDQKLDDAELERYQLYLYNCLNLLPYSDLTPYESIKIPQWIDDDWQLIEHKVTPIELTEYTDEHGQKILDKDRVFAYGLTPLQHPTARSHLIFMGTTYPAGQGFVTQVTTDLTPFETVGEALYSTGRERIKKWLELQKDKVTVSGISLGGSLTLLLAMDQGDKVHEAYAQNPAGLYEDEEAEFDNWDELEQKPKVVVLRQANDPVSIFGVWKKDWIIKWMFPPKDKQGPSSFFDHFLNYAGFEGTRIEISDAETENQSRKSRNFWLYVVGRSFVYYLVLWPYHHIVRPLIYFARHHRTALFLTGVGLLTVVAIATLLLTALSPILVGVATLATIGVASISYAMFDAICKHVFSTTVRDNEANLAHLHDPFLPRNPEMDIYSRKNKIAVTLTGKDWHSYYSVMRGLVKGQEYLPTDESVAFDATKIVKKSFLEATAREDMHSEEVTMKVTKAKAFLIRNTLTWIGTFGRNHDEQLKEVVQTEYDTYSLGKVRS